MPRPPTFGYLRSAVAEEAKLGILRGELVLHAGRRGVELVEVFEDVPCPGLSVKRPGFGRLLDALRRRDGATVLLPARCHLSWNGSIRQQLERRIHDAGADLHVLWPNGERPELRPWPAFRAWAPAATSAAWPRRRVGWWPRGGRSCPAPGGRGSGRATTATCRAA